ncbi:MAG: iron transporter FeoA [Leptospiraceae bacterium]|nr:MAG: iron transporter FeoA [Leptospiraceae bacterium]
MNFPNMININNKNTLDKIKINQEVIIKNIYYNSSSMIRLMEMGIIPGEKVKIVQIAPLGDPIEILIMGYKLCIRKSDAANIEVEYATNS